MRAGVLIFTIFLASKCYGTEFTCRFPVLEDVTVEIEDLDYSRHVSIVLPRVERLEFIYIRATSLENGLDSVLESGVSENGFLTEFYVDKMASPIYVNARYVGRMRMRNLYYVLPRYTECAYEVNVEIQGSSFEFY